MTSKKTRTICIDGRFIWHTDDFRGWNDLFKDASTVTILPYRGWTPALLVGDGENFFEVWKNVTPEELPEDGELYISTGKDIPLFSDINDNPACFRVCRKNEKHSCGDMTLQDKMTIDDALRLVMNLHGNNWEFRPSMVCTKGQGRLKELLADPQSTFIIAPCWRMGHEENGRFFPTDARENIFSQAPVLDLFEHIPVTPFDENRQNKLIRKMEVELRSKCRFSVLRLRCGGRKVLSSEPLEHNPCWKYTVSDYKSDGACFVLKPGYTAEGFRVLKAAVLDRMSALGMDAVFVKEGEECYVLGSRAAEATLEYANGSVIHLPRNYGERIPLGISCLESGSLADKMRYSLRSFLERLYSIGKRGFAEVENLPQDLEAFVRVPFIEEEIARGNAGAGNGMMAAMAFAMTSANHPIRRSQWERIDL